MAKLTLADVTNLLGNPTSAANTINANSALIETALENTLSRDGTTPNQMSADIDMNNNDLLNVKSLDTDTLTIGGVPAQAVDLANALKISNNLSDVADVATSRTNLGLGDSATRNVGTTAGTVPDGADRRFAEDLVAQPGKTMPPETGWLQRYLHITGDNLAAGAANPIARGLRIAHEAGGSTLTGGRIATEVSMIHTLTDSPSNTVKQFVALTGSAYGFAPGAFGGTAPSPKGALYGGNSIVTTVSGYTFTENITAHEFNTQMEIGSSTVYKAGIQVVSRDQVAASGADMGVSVSSITGALGYKQALGFGDQNGSPPVGVTGTLIGGFSRLGPSHTAAHAINLTDWIFTSSLLTFKNFIVAADGSHVIGANDTAAQRQIDFRTGGFVANSFDGRIAVSGGTNGVNGVGTMSIIGGIVQVLGRLEPANVAGVPVATNSFSFSADNSGFYIRWKDESNVQKIITLTPWVLV